MKSNFNYERFKQLAKDQLKQGDQDLLGKNGILTPLIKDFLEECLEGEMEEHLAEKRSVNRRNGKNSKKVKTSLGTVEISTPRDRDSSFEPQIIPKRQRVLDTALERQILTLYAKGSSYSDISDYLLEMYDIEVSTATISRITDKIIPLIQEWQSRPLESIYPIVWLDAIHYKVRHDGRVVSKAVYSILGVNLHGEKEILGLYLGENEGARFWLNVLNDLQNRGLEDIFISCIDNLKGFAEAVEAVFPATDVQLCVVHQIRNSKKYLSWKDTKEFMKDLGQVYRADTIDYANKSLKELSDKWKTKYPSVIDSWNRNWDRLSLYFQYPKPIRRLIYTTNPIESFHRQLRKVTKSKGAFTSDDALMKLLYLAQRDIAKKWSSQRTFSWNMIYNQLSIIFGDRINE